MQILSEDRGLIVDGADSKMITAGAEGWEAYAVIPNTKYTYKIFLKRPISEI